MRKPRVHDYHWVEALVSDCPAGQERRAQAAHHGVGAPQGGLLGQVVDEGQGPWRQCDCCNKVSLVVLVVAAGEAPLF